MPDVAKAVRSELLPEVGKILTDEMCRQVEGRVMAALGAVVSTPQDSPNPYHRAQMQAETEIDDANSRFFGNCLPNPSALGIDFAAEQRAEQEYQANLQKESNSGLIDVGFVKRQTRESPQVHAFFAYETVGAAIPHCGTVTKSDDPVLMQAIADAVDRGEAVIADVVENPDGTTSGTLEFVKTTADPKNAFDADEPKPLVAGN